MCNKLLFRWNKIPGEDYNRLEQFLVDRFGINMTDASFAKKGNIIEIHSIDKHSIELELDKNRSIVILKIDGKIQDEFNIRKEICVYGQQLTSNPSDNNKQNDIVKELKEEWNDIDTWVNTASENGLFNVQSKINAEEILCKLKDAKEALDNRDISNCRKLLSLSMDMFNKAIESAPRRWRMLYKYAIHIWAYLAFMSLIIFFFYHYDIDSIIKDSIEISQLAIDATIWGIIGSIFRGIWRLWIRVNRNEFRKTWLTWYLSAPLIGGILGALIFITAHVGLVIISGETSMIEDLNPFVIIAGSAFAGFKWKWAIERISGLMGEKEE